MGRQPALKGLPPVFDAHTRLLVLGSFPSAASLNAQQYYAHPRNLFWPMVGSLLGLSLAPLHYAQRLELVKGKGLGIWDVYGQCQRYGSLDAAIRNAVVNDLEKLVAVMPRLKLIAHNGRESAKVMRVTAALGVEVVCLPSTSPANASVSKTYKEAAWREAFMKAGLVV